MLAFPPISLKVTGKQPTASTLFGDTATQEEEIGELCLLAQYGQFVTGTHPQMVTIWDFVNTVKVNYQMTHVNLERLFLTRLAVSSG